MSQSVRFGSCTVNIALRTLQRDGEAVAVAPLVFDCLAYLIQHRDRAVGRDELVAAVWGKVEISDAALAKTILTARRAIGDDGESQRFLRTVPRFGYRWTAETEAIAGDESVRAVAAPSTRNVVSAATSRVSEPPAPPAASRSKGRLGIAATLVVVIAVAAVLAWRRPTPEVDAPHSHAELPAQVTAVLPAEVVAGGEDAWLRLGLMDLVASRISAAGVAVLPSDSMVRLVPAGTGRDEAIARVRRATQRGRLVALAVRRDGSQWIVHAELMDGDGPTQIEDVRAGSAILAATEIADRLLGRLGGAPARAGEIAASSLTELLQRIDATRLARQPGPAMALIDAAPPALQGEPAVRLRLAQILLDLGRLDEARDRLVALVAQVSAEADPHLRANAQRSLCIARAQLGQPSEALEACDEALRLLENTGSPSELARTYNNRGVVRLIQHQYDLAGRDFASAAVAARLAADELLLAQIEGNQSNAQSLQGHFADVAATQQRIGQRFERFGMVDEYVKSLIGQTSTWITLLHPAEALESSSLAITQAVRVEHAGTRLQAYLVRANALELSGRLGEQRVLLDRVLQEAGDGSLALERGIAHGSLARVELASGHADAALPLARQALADLVSPAVVVHRADAWLSIVRSLDQLHRFDEAGAEAQAFAAWAPAAEDLSVSLLARLAEAEQAAAAGRGQQAGAAYEAALDLARRWSAPDLLREVVVSYGHFLLGQDDLARAAAIIGQVAAYADSDFETALAQAWLYRALGQTNALSEALGRVRQLAGDRAIPPLLTATDGVVVTKSSSGNAPERDRQ